MDPRVKRPFPFNTDSLSQHVNSHFTKTDSRKCYLFLCVYKQETDNEILTRTSLELLHTRQKAVLIATLTTIAAVCFIMLQAIALLHLRYRLSAIDSHDLRKQRSRRCRVELRSSANQIARYESQSPRLATRYELPLEP